jgi:translation elongation factor P/translation initiation factor 5A
MKRSFPRCSALLCPAVAPFILAEINLMYSEMSHVFSGNLRANAQGTPGLIKTNTLVEVDGEPHIVQKVFQRGSTGPVQAKLMNMNTRRSVVKEWECGSTIVYLAIDSQPAFYSYFDTGDSCFVFFGQENGEEFRVESAALSAASSWLSEGDEVDLKLFDGKVFQFGFRYDVIAEVTDVQSLRSLLRTHTRAPIQKQKIRYRISLSNGEVVMGPAYIKIGDRVVVDPGTSKIIGHIKQSK